VEHIIPTVRGGGTTPDNLALSCAGCNGHKYDKVEGYDAISETLAALYHPRRHTWGEHFAWNEDFSRIIGLTPTGRTTTTTLHLNREGVVNLRRILLTVGLHPPEERADGTDSLP
jgi:HNH endonuclease